MMIQSGLHEKDSKLAIKTCKDDALAAFKNGEVDQATVNTFTEQEQGDRFSPLLHLSILNGEK